MSAWYICRRDGRADARVAAAVEQFHRHGHLDPRHVVTPYFTGIVAGHIHPGLPTFLQVGDDFIAIAGTLFYRGEAGEAALKRLLEDYRPSFDRRDDLLGHFAALVFKGGRLFAFTDWSASFHLYQSRDRSVFSTSFLSTARSIERLSFNPQAVYEFTFFGTPLANECVFREVTRPECTQELELGDGVQVHTSPRKLRAVETDEPLERVVDRLAARLRETFATPVRAYGNNIQCPLSGGFDSRLVLALLMDQGAKPSLYVYGRNDDPDVVTAKVIAKGEGFAIETFEKAAFRRVVDPDEFVEIVEKNFHEMDGTGMDGGMFDTGGNSQARHNRARGGALAVSGAAGEIFRNYFYLADRPLRTRGVVDAFYSAFDPADCTAEFDAGRFLERIDEKLQAALGVGPERRSRLEIEMAYPLFRCPPAFGREMSLVGRFGAYFLPFCEHVVIREASNIPVRWRTHGVFQSKLLARINRRLASYPSVYGHSFVEPPALGHRMSDAMSLYRPPWLRRYSFRMKRMLTRRENPQVGLVAPKYLGRMIDLEFPAMKRFFKLERVSDSAHYKSIATLEYLARHFADRLVAD